jgi:hypothetical protein
MSKSEESIASAPSSFDHDFLVEGEAEGRRQLGVVDLFENVMDEFLVLMSPKDVLVDGLLSWRFRRSGRKGSGDGSMLRDASAAEHLWVAAHPAASAPLSKAPPWR